MADLISRAAACDVIGEMIKEYREKGEDDLADGMILARRYGIKRLPAVDAAPVVHGRPVWINPLDPGAKMCIWKCSSFCSVCGDCVVVGWKYCPNCGARMDGEANG
jgi:hypothetical protein